jgi:hypothetical protein
METFMGTGGLSKKIILTSYFATTVDIREILER